MDDRAVVERTVGALVRRLRLLRATACSARFLVPALALGVPLLLFKALIPVPAWTLVGGLVGLAGILGGLYGLLAPLPKERAAWLADLRLDLRERLASALEAAPLAGSSELHAALVSDAASVARSIRPARAFPLSLPREARWLPPLSALVVSLALLPAVRIALPTFGFGETRPIAPPPTPEEARPEPQPQRPKEPPRAAEPQRRGADREVVQAPRSPRDPRGELNAVFRDTKLSQLRPDFGSFLKEGDERLRQLGKTDALPDLSRDFTDSPYQVMIRRMQDTLRNARIRGLTGEDIQRILQELQELGRRGGGQGPLEEDYLNDLEAGVNDPSKRAMDALARALSRLREKGDASRRGGKELRGSRERAGRSGSGEGGAQGPEGSEEGPPGGSLPGKGRSLQAQGDPTPRIGSPKLDTELPGEMGEGMREAYDTNLSGPGVRNSSRLPYGEVLTRYKKMMEETLGKEPIPFEYREQVRGYFELLEQR